MKRYTLAYVGWLMVVLAMTAIAFDLYARVERIGWREIASRMRATDATEATEPDEN